MRLLALAGERPAELDTSGTGHGTRTEHAPYMIPRVAKCSTVPRLRNGTLEQPWGSVAVRFPAACSNGFPAPKVEQTVERS